MNPRANEHASEAQNSFTSYEDSAQSTSGSESVSQKDVSTHSSFTIERPNVLATVILHVLSNSSELIEARALLDSGSQYSFVIHELVKMLNLSSYTYSIEVVGTGNKLTKINSLVHIQVR